MSEWPNLAPLQVWKKTELHTDACKQGFGAIFVTRSRRWKVTSRLLHVETNTAEEKYDSYELEKTMQKGANYSHSQMGASIRRIHYEIEHRAGSRMEARRCLSQYPVMM
ncbi:hypothetical protein TNCV_5089511, partial [Trichonephila clavipes]